jgi:hypothetical protein
LEPAGETFYLRVHTFLGLWRNKSRWFDCEFPTIRWQFFKRRRDIHECN